MTSPVHEIREIRCCCDANLIGLINAHRAEQAGLTLRELEDGTYAYDADGRRLADIKGAVEASGTKKTWRKTWRKK